jgi:Domain of unknown function (DUF4126)
MEVLQTLAVALGLAALSGYSLYLTVFLTGLAIHFDWIHLAPQYASLSVLGEPTIIILSGVLFVLEFFVDKIPWLDSIWDAIHTVIRPVGGALLAVQTLGHPQPVFDIIVGLLAGSVTFTAHSVKTGTRLMVNQSPEPFSNVAVSLAEDIAVGGLFALLWSHPLIAIILLLLFFSLAFYFLPKIWRAIGARVWFIRRKLKQPARSETQPVLPTKLPGRYQSALNRLSKPPQPIAWAVPCITGRGKFIPTDRCGYLVAFSDQLPKVYFLIKGWFGAAKLYEIDEFSVTLRQRFLYDELILYTPGKRDRYTLRFDRTATGLAPLISADLQARIDAPKPLSLILPVQPAGDEPDLHRNPEFRSSNIDIDRHG